jgi:hypothetical protein
MATFHPAERQSNAALDAAVPVPIIIKSNVPPLVNVSSLSAANNKDSTTIV